MHKVLTTVSASLTATNKSIMYHFVKVLLVDSQSVKYQVDNK